MGSLPHNHVNFPHVCFVRRVGFVTGQSERAHGGRAPTLERPRGPARTYGREARGAGSKLEEGHIHVNHSSKNRHPINPNREVLASR